MASSDLPLGHHLKRMHHRILGVSGEGGECGGREERGVRESEVVQGERGQERGCGVEKR